jgi:hypothetical protein
VHAAADANPIHHHQHRETLYTPDVNALGGTGTLEALIDGLNNFEMTVGMVSGSHSAVEIQILLVGGSRSDVEGSDLTYI